MDSCVRDKKTGMVKRTRKDSIKLARTHKDSQKPVKARKDTKEPVTRELTRAYPNSLIQQGLIKTCKNHQVKKTYGKIRKKIRITGGKYEKTYQIFG